MDFVYLAETVAHNSPPAKIDFELIYFAEALAENAPCAKFCFSKDAISVAIELFTLY